VSHNKKGTRNFPSGKYHVPNHARRGWNPDISSGAETRRYRVPLAESSRSRSSECSSEQRRNGKRSIRPSGTETRSLVGRRDPTLHRQGGFLREPCGTGWRVRGQHIAPGLIGQPIIHRMLEFVVGELRPCRQVYLVTLLPGDYEKIHVPYAFF